MSEFSRLKRLTKSLIPRFPRSGERTYSPSDARMMISELGIHMPSAVYTRLVEQDAILDDFVNSIYQLERKLRRRVITDMAIIDEELNPQVYVENGTVGFSITHKDEEIVFAEYELE